MKDEDRIVLEDIVTDAVYEGVQEIKTVKDNTADFLMAGVILFIGINLIWGLFSYNAINRTARQDPEIQYKQYLCIRTLNAKGEIISQQCNQE